MSNGYSPSPMPDTTQGIRFSLLFALENQPGGLERALAIFKRHGVSLSHIESRPSKTFEWEYDFMVEFSLSDPSGMESIKGDLSAIARKVTVISSAPELTKSNGTT